MAKLAQSGNQEKRKLSQPAHIMCLGCNFSQGENPCLGCFLKVAVTHGVQVTMGVTPPEVQGTSNSRKGLLFWEKYIANKVQIIVKFYWNIHILKIAEIWRGHFQR